MAKNDRRSQFHHPYLEVSQLLAGTLQNIDFEDIHGKIKSMLAAVESRSVIADNARKTLREDRLYSETKQSRAEESGSESERRRRKTYTMVEILVQFKSESKKKFADITRYVILGGADLFLSS